MKFINKKEYFGRTLVIIFIVNTIIFSSIFVLIGIRSHLFNENDNVLFRSSLKTASDGQALPYSSIYQNSSNAYRLFESIYFEINTSVFTNVDHILMQLEFENNNYRNYTMEHEIGTNFSYTYTPEYNAPRGFCNVSFLIFNNTNVQLNSHTTFVNFTIYSNYVTFIDKLEYVRSETVYGELIINNFKSYIFNWNITVVDNENESLQENFFTIGNDFNSFAFEVNDSFKVYNKFYYVKINMSDSSPSAKKAATYIPFFVLNTFPEIIIPSINFSKQEIKRAEECDISLNVSDNDLETFPENITVSMLLTDSEGQSLTAITLTNNNDWSFSTTFSIDKDKPIGIYQVIFEAKDQYNDVGTHLTTIKVKNNKPAIHGFTINGFSLNERISINYGEDIVFEFNVSDIEDTIAFITVGLLDKENNWYNISKPYKENMELIVRTEDLSSGVWYVYIAVTDIDNGTTYITSNYELGPKEIRIIPDLLSTVFPWITLFIGLTLGILIGIGLLYSRYKSRITEFEVLSEKKEKVKEKPSELKKIKKTKKERAKIVSKDEAEFTGKEKEVQEPKKRKIKRRLG